MTHKDSGWRPHLAMHTYEGFEIWDHNVGPHQINVGEVDGEIGDEGEESADE
jgi:hypothetical protein